MNVPEILALADDIERGRSNTRLEMSVLHGKDDCGTAACVKGWWYLMKGENPKISDLSAEHEMGLGELQAQRLFTPPGWYSKPGSFTAPQAVSVLRHLAQTGDVAWYLFDRSGAPVQEDRR